MLGFDYWWIWILKVVLTSTFFSLAILEFMPKAIRAWQSGQRGKKWLVIFSIFMYNALFLVLNLPHSKNLPNAMEMETLREITRAKLETPASDSNLGSKEDPGVSF